MSISFEKLKGKRKNRLAELSAELDKTNKGGYSNPNDDKYWKLEVDSAGNGYAIIRFLDDPEQEQAPFKKIYNHGFQGPGGWYIENSLTTIGKDDPVSEMNSELWNSGIEANKEIARKRKRRLQYVSNILVVHDPKNPENNGKVFLFSYGAKIFGMINDLMHPKFDDEEQINPFDYFEGANFHLKAFNNDGGFRDYTKSKFDRPGGLTNREGDELSTEECQEVIDNWHNLNDLHDESNFKSYDALKARLLKVLKLDEGEDEEKSEDEREVLREEKPKARKEEKPREKVEEKPKEKKEEKSSSDDDDIDFDAIFGDLMDD